MDDVETKILVERGHLAGKNTTKEVGVYGWGEVERSIGKRQVRYVNSLHLQSTEVQKAPRVLAPFPQLTRWPFESRDGADDPYLHALARELNRLPMDGKSGIGALRSIVHTGDEENLHSISQNL
jgi:hypothetical protein